jgi:hypothetical protein
MQVTSTELYFIDANIIMYAIGKRHPLKEPCRTVLNSIKGGDITVVTNTEVLQEILYRYFAIGLPWVAKIAYDSTKSICETIFPITLKETDVALEILNSYPAIKSRDAIHAATMLHHGLRRVISVDPHFDEIDGLQRIDPRAFPDKGSRS